MIEQQELINLRKTLDINFVNVIKSILKSKGKVVVTGIGKSAHIGNKFVATLNSTGTPAQFMHAAEAIHGDLGLLLPEDIVIIISNSGNSPEIKRLVPLLKKKGNTLIAITGNENSDLAKNSNFILNSKVEQEACPIDLAPTSSTTVQLVLCDAISVALMNEKGFEKENFAAFHPGGSLGKNLTTTVADLVKTQYKPQIDYNDTVKEVILSLSSTPYGITVVLKNNKIEGVITDGDLRRNLIDNNNLLTYKAFQIMSAKPKTIKKEALATTARNMMQDYDIGQLVVLDGDSYYGILEIHQLLEEGIYGR